MPFCRDCGGRLRMQGAGDGSRGGAVHGSDGDEGAGVGPSQPAPRSATYLCPDCSDERESSP